MTSIATQFLADNDVALYQTLESFRFEDENEDEDEDEALGFRHKEICKLFRLQLGRDNVVAINFVVPAKLKAKRFEDFVVTKTESFVLVLESKALYWPACGSLPWTAVNYIALYFTLLGICLFNMQQIND